MACRYAVPQNELATLAALAALAALLVFG
jgi:hypothetical protein